jgi:hypothetical protein
VSKAARFDGSSEDALYRELILSSMRRIVVAVLSIVITAATLIGVSFQVLSTQEVGLDYDLFSQTIGNQLFNPGTYFLGACDSARLTRRYPRYRGLPSFPAADSPLQASTISRLLPPVFDFFDDPQYLCCALFSSDSLRTLQYNRRRLQCLIVARSECRRYAPSSYCPD